MFGGSNCMMNDGDLDGWQPWHQRAGKGLDPYDEGVPLVDFILLDRLTQSKFSTKEYTTEETYKNWKCW